jgi:predicted DNA binding protein
VKSVELARSLGIAQSTLAQHLRKAEKRILDRVTSLH